MDEKKERFEVLKTLAKDQKVLSGLIILVFLSCSLITFGMYKQFENSAMLNFISNNVPSSERMFKDLTDQIINDAIIFKMSDSEEKEEASKELEKSIEQRKEYALKTMRESPADFLKYAISSELDNDLFNSISGIEKEVEVKGTVAVLCASEGYSHDEESNSHVVYVTAEDGTMYQMHLVDSQVYFSLNTGDVVGGTGYVLENNFVPDTLTDSTNFEVLTSAAPITPSKNNKVALIMLTDKDTPMDKNYTKEDWLSAMGDIKKYFEEVSFGEMTISGKNNPNDPVDVYGYYTIPTQTNCDYMKWLSDAQEAAKKAGFSDSDYRHVMYMIPRIRLSSGGSCITGAVAYVNGQTSWYQAYYRLPWTEIEKPITKPKVDYIEKHNLAHELGHNLGMKHAQAAQCYNKDKTKWVAVSDDCTEPGSGYNDLFDIMGSSEGLNHYSGYNKYMSGWIPSSRVNVVMKNGTYDLYPLEYKGTGTQLLQIPVTYKNTNGVNTTHNYYVDLTTDYGFNKSNGLSNGGVLIRTGIVGQGTLLYNVDPSACNNNSSYKPGVFLCGGNMFKSSYLLNAGKTFDDTLRGVSIKTVSVSKDKATIEVKYTKEPESCTRKEPTISMSIYPISYQKPGTPVTYTLNITNNDSVTCDASTFDVTNAIPTGFSADKTTGSVNLLPGMSEKVSFVITSPTTEVMDGAHSLGFTVSNKTSGFSKITTTNYFITEGTPKAVCTRANPSVSVVPITTTVKAETKVDYTVTVKNNDNDVCGASNFNISTTLKNWTIVGSNVTVSIAPGTEVSRVISITSKKNEKDGTTTVPFTIKNNNTGTSVVTNASYVVNSKVTTTTQAPPVTPTCNKVNPTISISPTSSVGQASKAITYTLSVKNNNSTECGNATYNLSASMQNGFNVSAPSTSLIVAAGKTGTLVYTVTPNATVTNGLYPLSITVKEGTATYSTAATYNVVNMTVEPPSITTSGVNNGAKLGSGNNKFNVTATHANGISIIEIYLNNLKVQTCNNPKNGSCEYAINSNKINAGNYVLLVEATANNSAKTKNTRTITFTN